MLLLLLQQQLLTCRARHAPSAAATAPVAFDAYPYVAAFSITANGTDLVPRWSNVNWVVGA